MACLILKKEKVFSVLSSHLPWAFKFFFFPHQGWRAEDVCGRGVSKVGVQFVLKSFKDKTVLLLRGRIYYPLSLCFF